MKFLWMTARNIVISVDERFFIGIVISRVEGSGFFYVTYIEFREGVSCEFMLSESCLFWFFREVNKIGKVELLMVDRYIVSFLEGIGQLKWSSVDAILSLCKQLYIYADKFLF